MTLLEAGATQVEFQLPVLSPVEPTGDQVQFFIETVKPRLLWHEHLGWMAAQHSNIVLGEE